jgi:FMN-dependent NADH-azoreductase
MKALLLYGSPHGKNSATCKLGSSFAKRLKDNRHNERTYKIQDIGRLREIR